jgi:hypothetical protein
MDNEKRLRSAPQKFEERRQDQIHGRKDVFGSSSNQHLKRLRIFRCRQEKLHT